MRVFPVFDHERILRFSCYAYLILCKTLSLNKELKIEIMKCPDKLSTRYLWYWLQSNWAENLVFCNKWCIFRRGSLETLKSFAQLFPWCWQRGYCNKIEFRIIYYTNAGIFILFVGVWDSVFRGLIWSRAQYHGTLSVSSLVCLAAFTQPNIPQ